MLIVRNKLYIIVLWFNSRDKYVYFGAVCITNIKGLWSLLGEQVEDLLSVGDSVDNSQVFVPAAQLCTDIIQSDPLVAVTLQGQNKDENNDVETL